MTTPPPDPTASQALIEHLRDRIVRVVCDSLGVDEKTIAATKLGARLEEILSNESRGFVERLDRSERLAHVGQLSSSAVHELRNPLSVIETSAFVISERAQDPRVARHAKRIAEQVALAGQIISDLLDAARGRPIHPIAVDTATLVRNAIDQLSPERAPIVTTAIPSPSPRVTGDERRLRQVLVNLLVNAFDATGENGPVRVVVTSHDGYVVIHVRDGGPGLAPGVIARLFEPLVTTKSHGTGLGLALSREIVLAHGGDLRAFNLAEGGACFEITLAANSDGAR